MFRFIKYLVFLSFLSLSIFSQNDIVPLTSKKLIGGDGKSLCLDLAISPNEMFAAAVYDRRGLYVWSLEEAGKYTQRHLSRTGKIDINDNEYVVMAVKNEIWLMEPDYLECSFGGIGEGKCLTGDKKMRETKIGTIGDNIHIIDIKFGRNDRLEAIVVYERSLQKGIYLERWDLDQKKMLSSVSTAITNISSIQLSKDRTKFLMNPYNTNDLEKTNYTSMRDSETLAEIQRFEHKNNLKKDAFFTSNGQIIGFLQEIWHTFSLTSGPWLQLKEPVAVSFFKDTDFVLSASKNRTIQLLNPSEQELPQGWVWPHYQSSSYPKYKFSSSGNKILTWDRDSGLQLWELIEDPAPYDAVLASNAYRNLPVPETSSRNGSEIDLTCEIKEGKITISNNNKRDFHSYGTIFWRVYEEDGELVELGRVKETLSRGEAIDVTLTENIDNEKNICEASFYTSYRNAP